MEVLSGIIVLLVYNVAYTAGATEEKYQYIGCFKDVANNRDLREKAITFTDLKLDDCASECRKDGWAYAALQNNEKCYCGPSYGAHGGAVLGACNWTCSDKYECGGSTASSIYYTVKIDSVTRLQRQDVVHKDGTNFEGARRICIQNEGDLALLDSPDHVNSSVESAKSKGVKVNKMWFGLRRVATGWYAWSDEKNTPLDKSVFDNFWKKQETWQNPCVVVKLGTSEWESTSCFAQYPFVCSQIPQATDDDDTDAPAATDPPEEDNNLALLIVLPIFSICYGGSCLVYCIAKLYRNCKKKKKMQLEKEGHFTEFEPDTKPTLPQAAPMAKNKTMPMPPPPPMMPIKPPDRAKTPIQEIKPAGPPQKRGYTPAAASTAPSSASPPDTRPATSRAVELGLMSPDRAITPAGEKSEKKRNKLLQNALKEARERKKDRESKMGSRPQTGVSRPESSLSRPDSATIINEQDDLPIPDKKKKKRKKRDSPDSGDSMTDLIGGDDKKEEPQKMSIQDIMKVKMLMKDGPKRPRRIIAI